MPYNQQYFTINLKPGVVYRATGSPKGAWISWKCWNESFRYANRAVANSRWNWTCFFFLVIFPVLLIKHKNEKLFCWVWRGLWIFWSKKSLRVTAGNVWPWCSSTYVCFGPLLLHLLSIYTSKDTTPNLISVLQTCIPHRTGLKVFPIWIHCYKLACRSSTKKHDSTKNIWNWSANFPPAHTTILCNKMSQ